MLTGFIIWGLSVTEWIALIGFIISIFSGLAWLFKKIVVEPFMSNFHELSHSMNNLTKQLEESKQDRQQLHIRVNKSNTRIDKAEGRMDNVETRLDYIEDDIKEIKNKE